MNSSSEPCDVCGCDHAKRDANLDRFYTRVLPALFVLGALLIIFP